MALTLKICISQGPYYEPVQETHTVFSLTSLLETVREAIDNYADAIGVYAHNEPVAIWLREPDFDYDAEGYYELETNHPFQVYQRYNRTDFDNHVFWQNIGYFFGTKVR